MFSACGRDSLYASFSTISKSPFLLFGADVGGCMWLVPALQCKTLNTVMAEYKMYRYVTSELEAAIAHAFISY